MKFYNLNTVFTFGKHKGKTLRQIIEIENTWILGGQKLNLADETSYIEWCIINIDDFSIRKGVCAEIKKIKSSFSLSEEALETLKEKNDDWLESRYTNRDFSDNDYYNEEDRYCGACMESPCMCSDSY